ncbi:MAG: protein translocase subunit SecD, partial [Gaiellaceae bacterium]
MRRYLLILFALIAAVAGVVVLAFFREPTLGLDLQGGLEVVLEARPEEGRELTEDDLDRSVEIIRDRVDRLGVGEPEIREQGQNQIAVGLAGVFDRDRATRIIGQTALLAFYDLQGDAASQSKDVQGQIVARPTLLPLLTAEDKLKEGQEASSWYLFGEQKERLAGPFETKQALLDSLPGGEAPEGSTFYVVPKDRVVLTCGENALSCPPGIQDPQQTFYYLYEYRPNDEEDPVPELTGEDLQADGTRQDFDQGRPIVTLDFTDSGGDKFHDITRRLAQRGAQQANFAGVTDNTANDPYNQQFAIVLDNEIRSYPQIDFDDNPDGIAGGNAQITGLEGLEEAKDLALVLQTGALPVEFVQVESTDISATLGEDSLREALIAGIGGLAAVALFLLLFYRFLGVIAILGLAIYAVFLYGAMLLFNVTLTLPGFAGLILTIGVAADANIVIFERIKEEVRAGKSVRAAIGRGYRLGFNTIVDANVVTAITAAILFAAATGGVKGFALMLLIGTGISMVTAVLATRALLGLLAGFRWFDNPAFMGASAQKIPAWQRVDFMGKRNWWFALSGTVLLIGVVSLGVQGLNLGIDFKGGSQVTFETPQPVAVEDVRREAAAIAGSNAVIQGRGDLRDGGYREFQIKTESLAPGEQTGLKRALEREFDAASIGVKNVSASFSQQILRSALIAITFSLLLLVLYIWWRFGFKYSLPVLAALVHDILVTLGIYSFTGREVTTSTVAAVLTILGYSIYDTIIIFDRVRENVPLMRKSSFAAIANQSLWETVRRSLATSFITLLPVSALLVFGGDTLKDFAFALLIGIGSGAYSTIFIATPILTMIKEREPEWEKRKSAGLREKLELTQDVDGKPVAVEEEEPEPVSVVEPEPALPDEPAAAAARRE